MGQLLNFIVHQHDIRRLHGNIAANAAHGNAHIRLFQRGGVVDAVANHANRRARFLTAVDIGELLLRQAARADFAQGQPAADGFCRLLAVSGQQNRLYAKLLYTGKHGIAVGTKGVGKSGKPSICAVYGGINDRAALPQQRFGFLFRLR